jgi:GR25 family glycosyltransferase involved in LPS biosynthesis
MKLTDLVAAPKPDLYPLLTRLIPIFYRAWTEVFPEISITVCLLDWDETEECLEPFTDSESYPRLSIVRVEPNPDLEIEHQQWLLTVLAPGLVPITEHQEAILLTDLDKLPLRADYYQRPLDSLRGEQILTYRTNSIGQKEMFTSYHASSGSTWQRVTGVSDFESCSQVIEAIISEGGAIDQRITRRLLFRLIREEQGWVRLTDAETGFCRLDRQVVSQSIGDLRRKGDFTDLSLSRRQLNGDALLNCLYRSPRPESTLPKCPRSIEKDPSSPVRLYDRIYIINLETRTDRYRHMKGELDRLELNNYQFFPAVKPTREEVEQWHPKFCQYMSGRLGNRFAAYQIGALGCLMSHLAIMREALEKGYERILILEDDTKFARTIEELRDHLPEIGNAFDMLYLTVNNYRIANRLTEHFFRVRKGLTTSAYIITRKLMEEVVKQLLNYPKEIDVFYTEKIQPAYRCLVHKPYITGQIASRSDIMQRHVNYRLK